MRFNINARPELNAVADLDIAGRKYAGTECAMVPKCVVVFNVRVGADEIVVADRCASSDPTKSEDNIAAAHLHIRTDRDCGVDYVGERDTHCSVFFVEVGAELQLCADRDRHRIERGMFPKYRDIADFSQNWAAHKHLVLQLQIVVEDPDQTLV